MFDGMHNSFKIHHSWGWIVIQPLSGGLYKSVENTFKPCGMTLAKCKGHNCSYIVIVLSNVSVCLTEFMLAILIVMRIFKCNSFNPYTVISLTVRWINYNLTEETKYSEVNYLHKTHCVQMWICLTELVDIRNTYFKIKNKSVRSV